MTRLLIYHALDSASDAVRLDSAADMSVVVRESAFRDQLAFLARTQRSVITLEEALGNPTDGQDDVVLTFDDGHRSNHSIVLPILEEFGMTAVFYVIAGLVDRDPDYMTQDQLRQLVASGMEIGSHTVTHRWLPLLSPEEVRHELVESRRMLEDMIGQPVLDFALPGGHHEKWMLRVAREAGYRSVATSKAGVLTSRTDAFRLPRLEVRRETSDGAFRHMLENRSLRRLRMIEGAKSCMRRTFGLKRYLQLRQAAHACRSGQES